MNIYNNLYFEDDFEEDITEDVSDTECPVCGGDNFIFEGRCATCLDCGWSKCSL